MNEPAKLRRSRAHLFLAGFGLSAGLLVAGAETFLRLFPMRDLHLYLGEKSPSSGPFVADPDWVVAYRSWDDFAGENEKHLPPHLPLQGHPDPRPLWAFFGNSFVQDHRALGDSARDFVTDRRVFHLKKLEPFEVRFAQIRLLLEHGFAPKRLFIEVMAVDTLRLGPHPLSTTRVSPHGAITFVPAILPGPLGWLTKHSRLALAARVRVGNHKGNRRYNMLHLYQRVDEPLLGDLCRLLGNLARITREKGVPVTVCLLADNNQIVQRSGCAFQDTLAPILRDMGFDVFDPRDVFLNHPDPASLFKSDGHFNDAGNQVLVRELVKHVEQLPRREHTVSQEARP